MARARTSRRTSIREKFSRSNPVSFEQSDFEEQEENSGKQNEEEGGILEYDSPGDDDIPSLERETDFTSEEVLASGEVFAVTAELCSVIISLSPSVWNHGIAVTFVFYALVEIVIRFFDTDLPVRLSVIEV